MAARGAPAQLSGRQDGGQGAPSERQEAHMSDVTADGTRPDTVSAHMEDGHWFSAGCEPGLAPIGNPLLEQGKDVNDALL